MMRLIKHAVLLFLLALMPVQTVMAQETATQSPFDVKRIALVDLNFVLRNAAATNRVRVLLDEKKAEFSNEFQEKEATLLIRERELNLRRDIISEADFNAEVQAFQDDVAAVQREIQFKRNSLDQAFQQAQDNLRMLAVGIIEEIANREALDMVMTREVSLLFRPDLNITQEVLSTLDERTQNARIEVGELPF